MFCLVFCYVCFYGPGQTKFQGMFLDLLLHARAILNSKLEISYEPCEAEYWEHYMFDFEG